MMLRNRVSRRKFEFARAMRNSPTSAEREAWSYLAKCATGYRFRRQAIIRGWIVDFWCPRLKLVIEIDGPYHDSPEQIARDEHRDRAIEALGIEVHRFKNEWAFNFRGQQAILRDIVRKRADSLCVTEAYHRRNQKVG